MTTAEVILLLNEADSLFARIGNDEVNDRFASPLANYLLQRIQNYDGVVLPLPDGVSSPIAPIILALQHLAR